MYSIISFLSGKKTYIVALVGLVYGLIHGDMKIVEVSILALTGRAAVTKIESAVRGIK